MSARKELATVFASSNLSALIGLISSMLVARLLSPAEIGVFSLALALVGVPELFRDLGVGAYIVQERDLTISRIQSAFWLAIVSSWLFGALFFAASWAFESFFSMPELKHALWLLTFNMILSPFGVVTIGYMRRQMMFSQRAKIEVGSALVNALVVIALAYYGFGVLSLGLGLVTCTLFTVAMTMVYRPKEWPMLPSRREVRRVLAFGTPMTGASLAAYVNSVTPDFILGKMLGAESVALFSRAMGVRRLFERICLGSVVTFLLPHLSAKIRANRALRSEYISTSAYMTGLGWPFFAFVSVTAEPIIVMMYGEAWVSAAPVLRALCLSAIISLPFWLTSQFLVAVGGVVSNLKNEIVGLVLKVSVLALFAPYGVAAVGLGMVCISPVGVFIVARALRHHIEVSIWEVYKSSWRSGCLALAAAAGAFLVEMIFQCVGPGKVAYVVFVLSSLVAFAVVAALAVLMRHPVGVEIMRMIALLRGKVSRGG